MKRKSKKSMQEKYVNQCVKDKDLIHKEMSKWECHINVIYMEDDKNCQSNVCSDKNCPETKWYSDMATEAKN